MTCDIVLLLRGLHRGEPHASHHMLTRSPCLDQSVLAVPTLPSPFATSLWRDCPWPIHVSRNWRDCPRSINVGLPFVRRGGKPSPFESRARRAGPPGGSIEPNQASAPSSSRLSAAPARLPVRRKVRKLSNIRDRRTRASRIGMPRRGVPVTVAVRCGAPTSRWHDAALAVRTRAHLRRQPA